MPRITLLKLHRLLSEHGWAWCRHEYLQIVRNRNHKLFRIRLAPPVPGLGCLTIEPYRPHLPYKDD